MKKLVAISLALLLLCSLLLGVVSAQGDALADRLLAEYNFNDGTTKDALSAHHATLYNDASVTSGTYGSGISGRALQLSTKGAGDKRWLSVPCAALSGNLNSFSLSLWYKSTAYNTAGEDSELFSFYNGSAEKFVYYSPAAAAFQDKAFCMKWDGTYGYANVITPYVQGQWVHLVYTVSNDGSQTKIGAFINGVSTEVDQGGEWTNSLFSTLGINNFTIGGKNPYKGGESPTCLFYGLVDEIKLYSGALTQTQATEIYEKDKTTVPEEPIDPPAGNKLLAEYNFDNRTTADSVDGKNATLYNDAAAAQGVYASGISGKGLQLSAKGTSDKYWLSVPYSVFNANTDSFALSMWYKASDCNSTGEDSELFSFYNSNAEKFLYYAPAATAFRDKGFTMKWDGTYGYANVLSPYVQGQWVHLVYNVSATDGQTKIEAYINGKSVGVEQGGEWANSLLSAMGINNFTIGGKNPYKGGESPACLFYGMVDEIKLYADPLTQDEVTALYADDMAGGGDTPDEDISGTLLAEYNFDDKTTNDAAGKYNAMLYDNALPASGKYNVGVSGNCLQLSSKNGSEKYWLSVPYDAFGGNRDNFSLSLWYRASDYNTAGEDSELFSLYNSGAEKYLFYSPASKDFQDKGFVMKWDGTYGYNNLVTPYQQEKWVHLVFNVSGDMGQTKIGAYVNGQEIAVEQGEHWSNSLMSALGIDSFTIGGKNPYKGGDTPACLFYGMIDEVRLYAGTLTAADAASLFALGDPNAVPDNENDDPDDEPDDTLLLEYTFDDQNTKDTLGKNNATLYNNASQTAGRYSTGVAGKSLQLSTKGSGEKLWLSVPYEAFEGHRDEFTLSLWYAPTDYNTTGEDSELFSLYNSNAERFLFYSPASTAFQDKGFTMKWNGNYGYANVVTPYTQNKWVHLVYVVSAVRGQSVITAYVNGSKVEVDQGGDWNGSLMSALGVNRFTIGGKNPHKGGDVPQCLYYGLVDEIRLYGSALTQEQAAELYKSYNYTEKEPTVLPVGKKTYVAETPKEEPGDGVLVAEYNFNYEHTKDSVGDYDATLYNDSMAAEGVYIDGVAGKALQLSEQGSGDKLWLSVPFESFGKDNDTFSISLWYNADGYNTSGEDSELFSLYNSKQEKFVFYCPASTAFQDKGFTMKWDGSYGYANVDSPYKAGEWVHLVYVVRAQSDKSSITAYVNGKRVAVEQGEIWTNSLASALGLDTFTIGGKNPYKGGESPACLFYGAIDEVKLYRGALSLADAEALYAEPETYVYVPEETEPETEPTEPVTQPDNENTPSGQTSGKKQLSALGIGIVLGTAALSAGAITTALLLKKKKRRGE